MIFVFFSKIQYGENSKKAELLAESRNANSLTRLQLESQTVLYQPQKQEFAILKNIQIKANKQIKATIKKHNYNKIQLGSVSSLLSPKIKCVGKYLVSSCTKHMVQNFSRRCLNPGRPCNFSFKS